MRTRDRIVLPLVAASAIGLSATLAGQQPAPATPPAQAPAAAPAQAPAGPPPPTPEQLAARAKIQEESRADHAQMMQQLGITAVRPGKNSDATKPNPANYDEALANPYPK